MQTFLPYKNIHSSADCLDYKRLGKQRVEVLQILKVLTTGAGGWANHPAVKMWDGHAGFLAAYGLAICTAWKAKGYKDTCFGKISLYTKRLETTEFNAPSWLGDKDFHDSHKSNLLRKDPEFYGQYGWDVPNDLDYVWPKPVKTRSWFE